MKIDRRKFTALGALSLVDIAASAHAIESRTDNTSTSHESIISQINGLTDKPSALHILAPNGCQANLKPIIDLMRNKTGISLDIDFAPVDDINTQLLLSRNIGKSYDLALPATFGIPDLANSNAIQALDTFAKRFEPEHFNNDVLYTLGNSFDNKLYGYQTDGDAYLMFYNRPWLENSNNRKRYSDLYGQDLNAPHTWEELDRHIRFFHNPSKSQYGGSLFRTSTYLAWEWWVRFHAKGFLPLADNLEPQIDNAAGVKALEELIAVSAYLSPGSKSNGLFENWQEYAKGNSYCNIGWGGTQKYLNSAKSELRGKLLFSPMPGGVIGNKVMHIPYFNWGWNYALPTNAKRPECAYLTALLATSPLVSTLAIQQEGYFDPFREIHYQDKSIQDIYSVNFLEAHSLSMRNSIPDFYLTGQSHYMNSLTTYIVRALDGKMKPHTALKAVADSWRNLHYRYSYKKQEKHWQRVKSSYPTALRLSLQ